MLAMGLRLMSTTSSTSSSGSSLSSSLVSPPPSPPPPPLPSSSFCSSVLPRRRRTRTELATTTTTTNMQVFSILAFIFHLLATCESLKLTRVEVPTMVALGQPFWLNCSYDLRGQSLYSIKWYHWNPDSSINGEFYRWLPNDSPSGQSFEMKGIHLDLSKSNEGHVYLTKSDLYTDGSFRCEVSAEAPSFQTVRKEKELHIYSLPSEKPTITGLGPDLSSYGPGDLINATCYTKPSRPPSTLTWFINDELVDSKFVKTFAGLKRYDGLEASRSELLFRPERGHYRNGLLKLVCLSNIVQPYTVTSEEVVIGDNSKYFHSPQAVTDSMANDMPIIAGIKNENYRVGEQVNLTCVSRAKPAPKLSFIVNDVEASASQTRRYPVFRLTDGLLASKLGLEFKVEPNDLSVTAAKQRVNHFTREQIRINSPTIRQYRIKCSAVMEKTIYTASSDVHLGTSKQSSGLHLAGNVATRTITFSLTANAVCFAILFLWATMP